MKRITFLFAFDYIDFLVHKSKPIVTIIVTASSLLHLTVMIFFGSSTRLLQFDQFFHFLLLLWGRSLYDWGRRGVDNEGV